MKIATQDLKVGWAIAYPAGAEVPDEALGSDTAKREGWADLVVGANTKTAEALRDPEADPAPSGTANTARAVGTSKGSTK